MATKTLTMYEKLESKLTSGITCFTFRKTDGTIKYAAGTRDLSLIPDANKPKTAFKNGGVTIPYYDMLSGSIKSLKRENIIRIACNIVK